ncbi:MAG: hypothetical protein DI551_09190 [Micavibrio aeruginosavorus]|uniref:Sialate O-acetylesterase domain-containing protein n=1 Tax=Micavibrio aeruginosavorus TaxID=349221 RepID=A0A2W5N221_9BACT|nr:MAG: hypothetical protein DI551_09190 [Micavibrio aeruginosavorus]
MTRLALALNGRKRAASSHAVSPLRFVTVQNRGYCATGGGTTRTNFTFYMPHVFGTDCKSVCLGAMNWYMTITGQANTGNDLTYDEISVVYNGIAVPVTWGGSSLKLIANGANKIISDEIPAYAFGVAKFDRNALVFIKGRGSVPVAGNVIPSHLILESQISGSQAKWYNPADTTPSNTNAPGAYTFTGVAAGGSNRVHCPFVLGRPVNSNTKVALTVGDSIWMGSHDNLNTGNNGLYGVGPFQRAMHDGTFNNPIPSCNFSLSSMYASAMSGSNDKWAAWCEFANIFVDELLTNDVINAGSTLLTMQTRALDINAKMRANSVGKCSYIRAGLLCYTSSNDNFATDQTVRNADWDTGGKVVQFNSWAKGRIGAEYTAYAELTSVLDPTNLCLFKMNGIAKRATDDGLHLFSDGANGVGNELAAADLRQVIMALDNVFHNAMAGQSVAEHVYIYGRDEYYMARWSLNKNQIPTLLDAALSGSQMLSANGSDYWTNGLGGYGPAWANFLNGTAIANGTVKNVFWNQGQSDYIIFFRASFKDATKYIFESIRAAQPDAKIIMMIPVSTSLTSTAWDGSTTDTATQMVREVDLELIAEGYALRGVESHDLPLGDNVHHTSAASEIIAVRQARVEAYYAGETVTGSVFGPDITGATRSGSTLTCPVIQDGGTDFAPNANPQGFVFFQGSTMFTAVSVTPSANSIVIELSGVPTGAGELHHIWGKNYGVTDLANLLKDNSPQALPLRCGKWAVA